MSKTRFRIADRFLAVLLALIMVIGMMPVTVFAAAGDYQGQFVVSVSDGQDPISEAEILYEVKVDGAGQGEKKTETDSDGTVGIDLSEFETQINGSEEVKLEYTISKEGFKTKKGEETVDSTTGTLDIELEPEDPEMVEVTVSKTGDGTVTLNGQNTASLSVEKGERVTVVVTPGDNARIDSLSIKGSTESVSNKYEAYTTTVDADDDIQISAVFVTEVTVTASSSEGGTIKLNGQEEKSVTVDKGSQVTVAIEPAEGYQISSVTIGGAPENVTDVYEFTKSITADDNVTVSAQFVKEYTITITKNGEGDFTTDPSNTGGSVTVVTDSSVKVTATANENYRVSKVVINSKETTFEDNTYDHNNPWTTELTVTEDYTIEITFAPTCFNITYTENENGTVTLQDAKVDYDGSTSADITAKEGFNVKTVEVNGTAVDEFEQINNKTIRIKIENITRDQEIVVTYEAIDEISMPDDVAKFKDTALRTDEATGLYVYANDAVVTFSTDKNGISINGIPATGTQFKTQSVAVSETTVIESIYIYDNNAWHSVKLDTPIKIVIDNETVTAPVLTPDAPHANDYYNKEFNIAVEAKDTGDYSGIAKVEYWITSDGKETVAKTEIYTYVNGDILSSWTGSISVDAQLNNSDNVVVSIQVTDRAGNQSDVVTCELKVNSTAPVISVEMQAEPKQHEEAENGYYTSKRTAIVTVVDRASTFNETAATDAIVIEANGKLVDAKAAMIHWTHSGDQHQATIEFSADAKYTWKINDYTNGAGLKNGEISATGENVYEFTVDGVAPTAKIEMDGSTWDKLVSVLTFGLWKNYSVTATVKDVSDETSEVKAPLYYKSDKTTALTEAELDQLFAEGSFVEEPYTVSSDEVFTIYARITDYAGNTLYISTNGVIYDKSEGEIKFDIDSPNENGIYVDDVNVKVSVDDTLVAGRADSVSSGIKSVDYKVESRRPGSAELEITQSGNLYTFDVETTDEHPTYEELKFKWDNNNDPIVVSAARNNSNYVIVTITVTDNAGNTYSKTTNPLNISTDKPTAVFDYEDEGIKDTRKQDDHFTARTAVIIVTDRNDVFDGDAAKAGISVTATDSKGSTIELQEGRDYTISPWTDETITDPSFEGTRDTHTAKISFITNGNYTIGFNYLNKTNDETKRIKLDDESFTKDATDPTGTVTIAENTWDKLLNVLTFGLYSKVSVDVTATAEDATSKVVIEYYKDNGTTALSADELSKKEFKTFEPFSVDSDERFTVYLKITDYAGNFIYVSSDGYIVDMVGSTIDKPVQEDLDGIYNKDVVVPIEINDAEPYSGIKRIDYRVIKDNDTEHPTQQGNLFTFTEENPTHDMLQNKWTGSITVDSELNNSNNVVVIIETEDNAGNVTTKSISLKIDITAPVIALSYPDNDKDNNGNTYFDHARTATVVITKRTAQFNAEKATAGITITAVDAKGNAIDDSYVISNWTTVEGATPDDATHTATIQFLKDANYTLAIAYTDEAGNPNVAITDVKGVAPWKFTVDTTPPTGTVTATSAEGRTTEWKSLLSSLTYGFWSNEKISITSTQDDITSAPIASVEYYKVVSRNAKDNVTALSKEDLDKVTTWTPFTQVEVKANEQFVIYLKITDLAGNYTYISTDGLIVDDNAPLEETIAPEITVNPEQPINGLYNRDVKVDIKVTDPLVGGTYSGLKTVSYRVLNMGVETQSGTLYSFKMANPKQEDLLQTWTGSITVDSTLNNSNDVVIEIIAEDNSQNTSRKSESIKIDITAPTIDVSYSNNDADNATYFKADRTATIVVTERNFNPDDVRITITNTDGVIPALSGWTKTNGTGNEDDTRWTATITYSADGDYTFDIAYTDLANNACSGAQYGNSAASTEFTVDKTLPTITVSYDNNEAANDKYFNASRTATVVIVEHNFDVNRVTFTRTSALNGANIADPTISWSDAGDTHTATIVYSADGDYTFDVTMLDMAGNESGAASYGNSVAAKDFTVDQTYDNGGAAVIGGVEDGQPYPGEVIPTINFTDVNYSHYEIHLYRTRKDQIHVDITDEKNIRSLLTEGAQTLSGNLDIFKANANGKYDVNDDGIYTLEITAYDMAGNEHPETVTFTVNRFGSVYVYDSYLISLIQNGGAYVDAVTDDLIIMEYNPNRLVNDSLIIEITRDGRSIDVQYVSDPVPNANVEIGQSGWYQYQYTISKDNFTEDGIYHISLSSKDEASNTPESTTDNTTNANGNPIVDTMQFRVDSTPPEITSITGLENRIINEQTVDVRYTVYDAIGLKSVTVYVNGTAVQTIDSFDDLNNYSNTFTITESSSEQTVRILVEDLAGNVTDSDRFGETDADGNVIIPMPAYSFNRSVTVSTNFFVRWYANKPLFWGSIGGIVVLAGAIWFLIVFLRKKKKNDEK